MIDKIYMVTARLTYDEKWITISSDSARDLQVIKHCLTVKKPDYFILIKKYPHMPVEESFINNYDMIPAGLWLELAYICQNNNITLNFEEDFNCKIRDCNLNKEDFEKYFEELFKESESIKPKDYQKDAVYNILQYKKCCVEISTSGGKTLISYMLFKYLIDVIGLKHILFITPKTNLTTQSGDKFFEYDNENKIVTNWTYSEIHAKAKKKKEYNDTIVFGNYQSLCKKKQEFFEQFDAVIEDECHHGTATSLKQIRKRCTNAKYFVGMTGTFPKEHTYENLTLQSYLGPVVYRLSSHDLINKENFATPVHVAVFEIQYLDKETKEALYNLRRLKDKNDPTAGANLLKMEKEVMRRDKIRFKYICDMIMKTTKNSLAIFSDIQTEYGHKIFEYIKEASDKNVYYIDGSTPTNNRDYIKAQMEADIEGNTIIIASIMCFSEGIDIANLWNIFLLESTKSETIIAQLLGRGMRRYPGKDKTMMIDFVDDYRFGQGYVGDNYLYKHGKERQAIYKKRGFPYKVFNVKLLPNSTPLVDE